MDEQEGSSDRAPAGLVYSPVRFGDVDEFSRWEIDLGWDIESVQLSAGANDIHFDNFGLPGVLIGRFRTRQKMHNVFAVPPGVVVFLICRAKLPAIWCGTNFPPTLMAIVRANRSHWAVLPAGFDAYEFMASEDWIRRTELFPPDFLKKTEQLEQAFLPLAEPATSQFLTGLDGFFRRAPQGGESPAFAEAELNAYVLEGLLGLIDAGLGARDIARPQPTRRPELVMEARELFLSNMNDEWTAERFAEALGVSYRTLNRAFKDATGIGPYQYFLNERLQEARRQLHADNASVTEICFAHGFNTPSRFARQYTRLFGELPSETQHRAARVVGRPGHGKKLGSSHVGPGTVNAP